MRNALITLTALTCFGCAGWTSPPKPTQPTAAELQAAREAKAKVAEMLAAADAEVAALLGPSDAEIEAADCGPRPNAPSEEWVTHCVRDTLRDPDSMNNFKFYAPTKMWDPIAERVRWTVLYRVNTKNGYGGYAGDQVGRMYQTKGGTWLVSELCGQ